VIEVKLPDGTPWLAHDGAEASLLYRTICEEECYATEVRAGAGDLIVDAGANIGIASLYFSRACPDAELIAIEPSCGSHEILEANVDLHGLPVSAHRCALGAERLDEVEFTFYPLMSTMSALHADPREDQRLSHMYLVNQGVDASLAAEILEGRHEPRRETVAVRTLSEILAEAPGREIAIVKLDVEGAELEVLRGIDEADWGRIGCFVGEFHGDGGMVSETRRILDEHGFGLDLRQAEFLDGSDVYDFYAGRLEVTRA
jgi:31-O-methyltransferase